MVRFYVEKIKNGNMTLEEVPKMWRDRVKDELDKLTGETTADSPGA